MPRSAFWNIPIPKTWLHTGDVRGGGLCGLTKSGDVTRTQLIATNGLTNNILTYRAANGYYGPISETPSGYTLDNAFYDTPGDGDALMIGWSVPWACLQFAGSTGGVYTGDACKLQYYGASGWTDLTVTTGTNAGGVRDGTDAIAFDGKRPFGASASLLMVPPADWTAANFPASASPTTPNSLYWARWLVVTAANIGTVAALVDEPYIFYPTYGFVAPETRDVIGITVYDNGATLHANTVKFYLMNFTTGACSKEISIPANTTIGRYTGTTIHASSKIRVNAGDTIWPVCTQKDATNEITNATMVLEVAT